MISCVALAGALARFGIALATIEIDRRQSAWAADGGGPSSNWEDTWRISKALAGWPWPDADIAFQHGQLLEWRAVQQRFSPRNAIALRHEAVAQYRRALHYRPAWGVGWSSMAVSLAALDRNDSESRHALRRAIGLGSWEPGAQQRIALTGLILWRQLGMKTQQELQELFRFMASHGQYRWLQDSAQRHGLSTMMVFALDGE
ncbi:MAG: hypothetical protein OEQ39_04620 [Gammaproteobacteria bacterium]|nr:hypothetical protein [Gammaproteobacteria bacterium]MDH3465545.1 hypothetical protein [Gammaproteobacteria bacterium]